MSIPRESCPNCGAIWSPGSEEWDWRQCYACGWPGNDEDEFDEDDDSGDFDDEDDDPNDSRNL